MTALIPAPPRATGEQVLQLATEHIGDKYVLGVLVPKDNADWQGPCDCSEFASWVVFQTIATLYGCDRDEGDPATADAYGDEEGIRDLPCDPMFGARPRCCRTRYSTTFERWRTVPR